jgi:hypothetical protein
LTEAQLKLAFLQSMPQDWQETYEKMHAGADVRANNVTMTSIVQFMVNCERHDDDEATTSDSSSNKRFKADNGKDTEAEEANSGNETAASEEAASDSEANEADGKSSEVDCCMCSVDDTKSDTLSHHFDCFLTTLQTNEVAKTTEADECKRLEPLVETFFVERDDKRSIYPDSESSVRPMAISIPYSEVLVKTPDSKLVPLAIPLVHKLQKQSSIHPLTTRALLDTGLEIALEQERCIPWSITITATASKRTIRAVTGQETKLFDVTTDESEWGSPNFIIPKNDRGARLEGDFYAVNKVLPSKKLSKPLIIRQLWKRPNLKYFPKLDLIMTFFSFKLDKQSQRECTTVTQYITTQQPNAAPARMGEITRVSDAIEVYIDDIALLTVSTSWQTHYERKIQSKYIWAVQL